LQALLTSERSCANPRRVRLHAGNPTAVNLLPALRQCRFELHDGGRSTSVELEQAQCTLSVVPRLAENGKLTLRITPVIKHGETVLAPRPLQEPSGTRRWELMAQQPSEQYDRLSWEVTLALNEYLVIGARLERGDALGPRCFVLTETAAPVQRLLVLRACRPEGNALPADEGLRRAPPIALQAGWSAARGISP
jgi:hypothetical protein